MVRPTIILSQLISKQKYGCLRKKANKWVKKNWDSFSGGSFFLSYPYTSRFFFLIVIKSNPLMWLLLGFSIYTVDNFLVFFFSISIRLESFYQLISWFSSLVSHWVRRFFTFLFISNLTSIYRFFSLIFL